MARRRLYDSDSASTKQRSARRIETVPQYQRCRSCFRLQPNSDPHGGLKLVAVGGALGIFPRLQPNSDPHGGLKHGKNGVGASIFVLQPNSDPHGGLKLRTHRGNRKGKKQLQPNSDPHGGLKPTARRTGSGYPQAFNQTAIRTAD